MCTVQYFFFCKQIQQNDIVHYNIQEIKRTHFLVDDDLPFLSFPQFSTAADSDLVLTFSEQIVRGTGNIVFTPLGEASQTYDVRPNRGNRAAGWM